MVGRSSSSEDVLDRRHEATNEQILYDDPVDNYEKPTGQHEHAGADKPKGSPIDIKIKCSGDLQQLIMIMPTPSGEMHIAYQMIDRKEIIHII